jgi:hypothetical protein
MPAQSKRHRLLSSDGAWSQYNARPAPMTKSHTLQTNLFHVNPSACLRVADVIRSYRASTEDSPNGPRDLEQELGVKLAVVAVCHDINWDFLQRTLGSLLVGNATPSIAQRLAKVRSPEVYACLRSYPKPDRILSDSRAALLRDVGRTIISRFANSAMKIYEQSGGKIHGDHGFLRQLDLFESYRADPLRKKSHVLIQEVVRERILRFEDEHLIEPAIDYHIQRLYLRTDRVVCTDRRIEQALRSYRPRQRPRLVKLLRLQVSEALKLTAFYAKLPIPDVNYIEWQIARSVCTKDRPFCVRPYGPTGLDPDIARLFSGLCPFVAFCPGQKNTAFRSLKQPNFQTTFY